MDRVKVIPFSEYKPRRQILPPGLTAEKPPPTPPAPPPVYTTPEDDPACKFNGQYVVADCYCKYPDFYTKNKAQYNLEQEQLTQYNYYCWQQVKDYPHDPMCNQFKSKEDVTIDCYCTYPDAYRNSFFGFSGEELSHMDAICKRQAAERAQYSPPSGFEKFGKTLEHGALDVWKFVSILVTSIFSPEGIAKLMAFVAVTEVPRAVFKWAAGRAREAIAEILKEGVLESALRQTAERVTKESVALVGDEIASGMGAYVVGVVGEAVGDLMATATVASLEASLIILVPGVGLLADAFLAGLNALMIAGMVFDVLGERFYGYNHQLAAKDLIEMSDGYNQIFMQVIMAQLRLPGGNEWPAEFLADNLIAQIPQDQAMQTSILSLDFFYIVQYMSALTFNSRGEFIYHPNLNQPGQFPFNENTVDKTINDLKIRENLRGLSTSLLYLYSNDNTSVVIFLRRNWFVLIIIILVVIIFVLYIK